MLLDPRGGTGGWYSSGSSRCLLRMSMRTSRWWSIDLLPLEAAGEDRWSIGMDYCTGDKKNSQIRGILEKQLPPKGTKYMTKRMFWNISMGRSHLQTDCQRYGTLALFIPKRKEKETLTRHSTPAPLHMGICVSSDCTKAKWNKLWLLHCWRNTA